MPRPCSSSRSLVRTPPAERRRPRPSGRPSPRSRGHETTWPVIALILLAASPSPADDDPGSDVVVEDAIAAAARGLDGAAHVVIGTARDGDPELDAVAAELIRRLVEAQGARFVGVRGPRALGDVLGGDRDVPDAVDADLAFLLRDAPMPATLELARWIRGWNLEHPDDPVLFSGLDPTCPRRDLAVVSAVLAPDDVGRPDDGADGVPADVQAAFATLRTRLGPANDDRALLARRAEAFAGGRPLFDADERAVLSGAITTIELHQSTVAQAVIARDGLEAFGRFSLALAGLGAWIEDVDRLETTLAVGPQVDEVRDRARRRLHGELAGHRHATLGILSRPLRPKGPAIAWTDAFGATPFPGETVSDRPDGPVPQSASLGSIVQRMALNTRDARFVLVIRAGGSPTGADRANVDPDEPDLPARLRPFTLGRDAPVLLVARGGDGDERPNEMRARLERLGLVEPGSIPLADGDDAPRLRGVRPSGFHFVLVLPPDVPAPVDDAGTDDGA